MEPRQPVQWHLDALEAIAQLSVRVATEVAGRIDAVRQAPPTDPRPHFPEDMPVVHQMAENARDERLLVLTRVFERIARGVRLTVALDLRSRSEAPVRGYTPRAAATAEERPVAETERRETPEPADPLDRESTVERDPVLIRRPTPSKLRDFIVNEAEKVGLDVEGAPELRGIPPDQLPKRLPPHPTFFAAPRERPPRRKLVPF